MTDSPKLDTMLPHPAPVCGDARLLLFAMRRMTVHGLDDAFATSALLAGYGLRYRRPLLLLRAMLVDIAGTSRRNIMVAPCCAPRMTDAEHVLLRSIADPAGAENSIAGLLGSEDASGPLATIAALADNLEAMGRPLRL